MTLYLLKYVLVILHIITAAAWFGLGLRLAGQARLVLSLRADAALAAAVDTRQTVRLMGVFVLLTLLFSYGSFFAGGGFRAYGPAYHVSLTLMLALVAVQYAVVRPAWRGIAALVPDALTDAPKARSYRKRLAMGVGIGHLLWLVLLVLMFWDRLSIVFRA